MKLSRSLLVCVLTGLSLAAQAQIQWASRNPNLLGITYGKGKFVAVGEHGSIWTSSDALTWETRPLETRSRLSSVIFANDTFVATGGPDGPNQGASILSSQDGISWHVRQSTYVLNFRSVAFGNDMFASLFEGFCVFDCSSLVAFSQDGVSWAQKGLPGALASITFGQGKFVAVGPRGSITESSNLADWTTTASLPDGVRFVGYANNVFIALGDGGIILTSTNGVEWSRRVSGTEANLTSMAHGNGVFTVIGEAGLALTSTDTINWTLREISTARNLRGITFAASKFVAVGDFATVMTSLDGVIWTPQSLRTHYYFEDVSFGANRFVAIARESPEAPGPKLITSTNGISWIDSYSTTNQSFGRVEFAGKFFFVTGVPGLCLLSGDGINWIARSIPTTQQINSITYRSDPELYIGVGVGGALITSPDAENWTLRNSGTTNDLWRIVYGNNRFVVTSGGFNIEDCQVAPGVAFASSDGFEWDSANFPPNFQPTSLAFGAGRFLIAGTYLRTSFGGVCVSISDASNGVFSSEDGKNWFPVSTAGSALKMIFANDTFVILGENILTSPDGTLWTARDDGVYASGHNGIAFGNGSFIAAGWRLWTSPAGPRITESTIHDTKLTLRFTSQPSISYTLQAFDHVGFKWDDLDTMVATSMVSTLTTPQPANRAHQTFRIVKLALPFP